MEKKMMVIAFAGVFALSFAACGSSDSDSSLSSVEWSVVEETEETEETEESSEEVVEDVEVLILSNENVDIYYTGCTSEGLNFSVTNYMDSELYLVFDSLALDYVSYDIYSSDYFNSFYVFSDSIGIVQQEMPEGFLTDFSTLSGALCYGSVDSEEENYFYFEDIEVSDDPEAVSMEAEGTSVYGDDNVEIYFEGCDSDGAHLMICNHTESELWITFEMLVFDGVSYDVYNSDYYNSFNVAPGGYGEIIQQLSGDAPAEVYEMSGTFVYSIGYDDEEGTEGEFTDVIVE